MRAPPRPLQVTPFRRKDAIGGGLLTAAECRGPRWQRLYQGVYIERAAFKPGDHRMWCAAAHLLMPRGAAIGGRSAAYLWNVDVLERDAPVTVVVPHGTSLRAQPMLHPIRGELPRADVESFLGLRVTTPLRTAFDLGRDADRVPAVIAVDAMLHRGLVTVEQLHRAADAHPGWRGVMRLRGVVAEAEPGAASPMETRLRLLIVEAGLPRPVAQFLVRDVNGRVVGRVDLAYPQWRIAIEYEGDHHRDPATFRKDIMRFNRMQAAEWAALRFTADDVFTRPRKVVGDVRRAVACAAGGW